MAREALRRKIDFERNAEMLGRQLAAQQEISAKLKRDLTQLEAKYDEAIRNRDALIARHRTVLAQQQVARSSARLNLMDPSSELARMEARIRGEEARTAAYAEVSELSLDKRLDSLEADTDLDLQLADMKARLRGELPAPDPAKAEAQPKPARRHLLSQQRPAAAWTPLPWQGRGRGLGPTPLSPTVTSTCPRHQARLNCQDSAHDPGATPGSDDLRRRCAGTTSARGAL